MAIIALLMVVILPRALQQVEKMSANRIAMELGGLRTGLNSFMMGTGTYPLLLSHLANPVTLADLNANQQQYTARQVNGWNGPYLDLTLPASYGVNDIAKDMPFDGQLLNSLVCYDIAVNEMILLEPYCPDGSFVATVVIGLLGYQFDLLNSRVDGDETSEEAFGRLTGKLRYYAPEGVDVAVQPGYTLYLVGPWSATF